ncbi:MAG: histidine kinase, partial [Opitutus sp.]
IYLVVTHVRYALRVAPELLGHQSKTWVWDVDTYAYNTFAMLPLDFLTYCGFFAVSFSVDYYFTHRQRSEEAVQLQLRAAQLQSALARAELAALRGQLHPHFLFNSFNALATLVRQQKNDAAVEIIAQLSALLRLAIDRTGLQEIPLHQEIDFIQRYLDIEHVRFGDKLRVEFALAPDSLEALVPNIVLQPLVENAIKHGISLRTTPGTVRLSSIRSGDRLRIEIADDGSDGPSPACTNPGGKKPGIGLANTRAQLDTLYGADYRLKLAKRPAGGTVVL